VLSRRGARARAAHEAHGAAQLLLRALRCCSRACSEAQAQAQAR
jgi:hypothetical protein